MATAVEEAGLTFSVDAASLTTTSSQQNEPTDSGCTLDDTQSTVNVIRKIICRYGRGCTHQDPLHLERFWHPPLPQLSEEKLRTHYICNECGQASPSLQELQVQLDLHFNFFCYGLPHFRQFFNSLFSQTHLERKTAWSNSSLVGCRISCLVDYKEWHEALVTQFHKSGKHFVEFRLIGERRWLNMKKIAFYIVERPNLSIGEYKDDEMGDTDGMAPLEPENWVYCENISLDYAFSQSVLYKAYGGIVQETGHKTKGHVCLTDDDKDTAKCMGGSLLYGELLPRGANKAFNPKRLDAGEASVLFDLGMGTGKIAMQAFLQFRNLDYVYGIELSEGRYKLAEDAALLMVSLLGEESFSVQLRSGRSIIITEIATEQESARVLHLECGNMFEVANMDVADIVMMETDIPAELHTNLCTLLGSMHEGSRTLTYLDLRKIWNQGPIPFKQLDVNRHLSDRFPTSWSVQRGHHFFLWSRICMPTRDARVTYNGQESQDGGHMTYSSRAVSKCLPFNLGISSLVGYLRSGGKLKHRDNIVSEALDSTLLIRHTATSS